MDVLDNFKLPDFFNNPIAEEAFSLAKRVRDESENDDTSVLTSGTVNDAFSLANVAGNRPADDNTLNNLGNLPANNNTLSNLGNSPADNNPLNNLGNSPADNNPLNNLGNSLVDNNPLNNLGNSLVDNAFNPLEGNLNPLLNGGNQLAGAENQLPGITVGFQQVTFAGQEGREATITLARTGQNLTQASTVRVNIGAGTATAGVDFRNNFPQEVVFGAGQEQASFNIGLYSDLMTTETAETISFSLEPVNNATINSATSTATLNIANTIPDISPLTLNATTTQIAYVAYYGRPADNGGAKFWSDLLTQNGVSYSPRGGDGLTGAEQGAYDRIINQFGNSPEANRLFGGLSNRDKVNLVYNHAFDRNAETAGLNFWTQQLNSGSVTLANFVLEVALGAQNQDAMILRNKIASANIFSQSIQTPQQIQAYKGSSAEIAGRAFLDRYGLTVSSQASAQTAIDNLVV